MLIFLISLLFSFLGFGCASKVIVIKGTEGATASLASFQNLYKDEATLGKIPVEIPMEKMIGKILKVSKSGKQTAYWLVAEASGEKTTLTVELPDSKEGVETKLSTGPLNQILRLTFTAYRELSKSNFEEAKQLAEKASQIAPEAAAPQVIIGIALAKEGDKTGSRAAFLKAKSLDPDDVSLSELMASLGVE